MRKQFFPTTENCKKDEIESGYVTPADSIEDAQKAAPWAAEIIEVDGGYCAYEGSADLEQDMRQM